MGIDEGMDHSQRRDTRHDAGVREAAPDFEHDDIAKAGLANLVGAVKQEAQIPLLAAMQKPVARIGPRIEFTDQTNVSSRPSRAASRSRRRAS